MIIEKFCIGILLILLIGKPFSAVRDSALHQPAECRFRPGGSRLRKGGRGTEKLHCFI